MGQKSFPRPKMKKPLILFSTLFMVLILLDQDSVSVLHYWAIVVEFFMAQQI